MSFDPNLYAIQIELSLDTSQAYKDLEDFESKVVQLEQSISNSLNSALSQVSSQIQQINSQLEISSSLSKDFAVNQLEISNSFSDHLEDHINKTNELEKEKEIYDQFTDFYRLRDELGSLNSDLEKEILESYNDQRSTLLLIQELLDNVSGKVGEVANGVSDVSDNLNQNATDWDEYRQKIEVFGIQIQRLGEELLSYTTALVQATYATESFITINNRAYGGQHELAAQVAMTAGSYGLLREESQRAYEAMIGIGVPIEELDAYAVTLSRVERLSGISINTLAEYTRVMRGVGQTANDVEESMEILLQAQYKYKLSASEVSTVVSRMNSSMIRANAMYGSEAPEALLKTNLAMTALAKATGVTEDAVASFNDRLLLVGDSAIEFYSKIGVNPFGTLEEKQDGQLRFYDRYLKQLDSVIDKDSKQYKTLLQIQQLEFQRLGLDYRHFEMVKKLHEADKTGTKTSIELMNEYNKSLENGVDLLAATEGGTSGLARSWNALQSAINGVIEPFQHFLADSLAPYIRMLAYAVAQVANFIKSLKDMWVNLEKTSVFFVILRQNVQYVIGLFLFIGVVIGGLLVAFGSLVVSLTSVIGSILTVIAVLGILQNSLTSLGTSAGQAITNFINAVGPGLQRLGAMATRIIVPMLAIGASFLMIGAGALAFAYAASILYNNGEQLLGMFAAMLGIVLVFTAAMVGLGLLAGNPVIIAGLLAIGAAIFLIGAGVGIAAAGIGFLVNSFTNLLTALTDEIGSRLVSLTNGLIYLSTWSPLIAAGLLTLTFSLTALVVPAIAASAALMVLSSAFAAMMNFEIPDIGTKLKDLAAQISDSVDDLNSAGNSLITASVNLLIGSTALLSSIVVLGATSFAMSSVSTAFYITSNLFAAGAAAFLAGSVSLITGANNIVESTSNIAISMFSLSQISSYMFAAAASLLFSAPFLMSGAIAFNLAVDVLTAGIKKLDDSAFILQRFVAASKNLSQLNFFGLKVSISDVGEVANNIDYYVELMESASSKLNNIEFDASNLTSSIFNAAQSLSSAVDQLSVPVDNLSKQISLISDQIDHLSEQELKIKQIGLTLNDALPNTKPDTQIPDEFKNVTTSNEVIENLVKVESDSSEMVALLTQIVKLLENSKEPKETNDIGNILDSIDDSDLLSSAGIKF